MLPSIRTIPKKEKKDRGSFEGGRHTKGVTGMEERKYHSPEQLVEGGSKETTEI